MKIAYLAGVSFHRDLNLIVWQPRGILDELHVEKIISTLEELEDEAEEPFDRFTDLSKVDQVEVNFDYIFRISLHRRAFYSGRPPVKAALYVEDRATAELALTHAVVTAGSPLQVKVCLRKSDAAEWLGVSLSDLEVDR